MLPYKDRLVYMSIEYASWGADLEILHTKSWDGLITKQFEALRSFTGLTWLHLSLGMLFPRKPTESNLTSWPPPLADLIPPNLQILQLRNDYAKYAKEVRWLPEDVLSMLRVFIGRNVDGKGDGAWQQATPKLRAVYLDADWDDDRYRELECVYWSKGQQEEVRKLCRLEPDLVLLGSMSF